MISVKDFYDALLDLEIDFFTGVPDSLLKNICAYISDNTPSERNIIAANEGSAVALAAGYHIATDKTPLVYMQNSGIGNAVNPLLSLADKDVYQIPMLLMIGWRGEPGIKDEPQHMKQGKVTCPMLDSMDIPYFIINMDCDFNSILKQAMKKVKSISAPVALVIKKNSFAPYILQSKSVEIGRLTREHSLELLLEQIPENSFIVSTTGMLSRELFELREKNNQSHKTDFLTVGSMGHASQIAMGIALAKPNRKVFCLDGDGATIMHAGNLSIIGANKVKNLHHIIFNNAAHDSVGGQPTVGNQIDFKQLALANNYLSFTGVEKEADFSVLNDIFKQEGPIMVEIKVKKGARKNLGRPTTTPVQNKENIKSWIRE